MIATHFLLAMFSKAKTLSRTIPASLGSLKNLQIRKMSSLDGVRPFVPRRALMYVPGSDSRKIEKIPKLGADCICLDCEDGVAIGMKEQVRKQITDSQTEQYKFKVVKHSFKCFVTGLT